MSVPKHSGRFPWGSNMDNGMEARFESLEKNLIRLAERVHELQAEVVSLKQELEKK